MRQVNLAPETFGNSPAEMNLAKILNEIGDAGICREVTRRVQLAQRRAKWLATIPDSFLVGLYMVIVRLVKEHTLKEADCGQFQHAVATQLQCCITTAFRKLWRDY